MTAKLTAPTRWRRPGWDRRQAGIAARDACDWAHGAEAFGDYLALNPSDARMWVQYGHCRKELGDVAEAERAYRRAALLDPSAPDPLFQLGRLLLTLARRGEGIDLLHMAEDLGLADATAKLEEIGC